MITKLKIEQIRIDGGTQNRVEINQEAVKEYAETITEGAKFPPIIVFFDGINYWLADGFHRYHAHRDIKALDIDVDVKNGTKRDAVLYSVGVNATHGLKRTNSDKRKAVETLLNDPEWSKWSDREIARACVVSPDTVGRIRKEFVTVRSDSEDLSENNKEERSYTTKHGTESVMNVENIGKKQHENKHNIRIVESNFQEESDYDPEQDRINELSSTINDLQEENEKLRSALAINQIPEGLEIEDADTIIDTLRARVKQLEIEVKAITQSRDTYLRENSQLKEQIRRQAAQLKKLGVKASA